MPIIAVPVSNQFVLQPISTDEITTAIWTFVPGEVLDFTSFSKINTLHITAYLPQKHVKLDDEEPDAFEMIQDSISILQNNSGVTPPTQQQTPTTHKNQNKIEEDAQDAQDAQEKDRTTKVKKVTKEEEQTPEPYTIPSLSVLFPNLTRLFIKNWEFGPNRKCFIGRLTDVPHTLLEIILDDTYITDFGPVLSYGVNLLSITLRDNVHPIYMSHPLPDKLISFTLFRTILLDPLIFPQGILNILCGHSTIPKIYGLENNINLNTVVCSFDRCITPYNLDDIRISPPSKTRLRIQHIALTNAQQVYSDFGSIPNKIQVSQHNIDNPIVVAMNLSTNYPRRMAEFIAQLPTPISTPAQNRLLWGGINPNPYPGIPLHYAPENQQFLFLENQLQPYQDPDQDYDDEHNYVDDDDEEDEDDYDRRDY